MTVIAIGRGPEGTFNVLLGDTTVGTTTVPCQRMKIVGCGEDIFCTIMGDEMIREAAVNLAIWHDPKRLDFKKFATANAVFVAASRLRMLAKARRQPLPPSTGSTLLICTRDDALYWETSLLPGPLETYSPPVGPHQIAIGELKVLYAGDPPVPYANIPDAENPFALASECIDTEHAKHVAAKRGLTLLSKEYGGVMIPQAAGKSYQWRWPFGGLPEMWAYGDPEAMHLAKNSAFTEPLPAPEFR